MDIISMCHPTEVISVNMRNEKSHLSHWSLRYVTRYLAHAHSLYGMTRGHMGSGPPTQAMGDNRKGGWGGA